jgi:hypothetical protein
MVNHSSRGRKLQTIYLWRALQSEPGMDDAFYTATLDNIPPAPLEPIRAIPGLVHAESLYGDWHLVGTCNGLLVELTLPGYDGPGEIVVENRSGDHWDIESIIRGGRYRKPKVFA